MFFHKFSLISNYLLPLILFITLYVRSSEGNFIYMIRYFTKINHHHLCEHAITWPYVMGGYFDKTIFLECTIIVRG